MCVLVNPFAAVLIACPFFKASTEAAQKGPLTALQGYGRSCPVLSKRQDGGFPILKAPSISLRMHLQATSLEGRAVGSGFRPRMLWDSISHLDPTRSRHCAIVDMLILLSLPPVISCVSRPYPFPDGLECKHAFDLYR